MKKRLHIATKIMTILIIFHKYAHCGESNIELRSTLTKENYHFNFSEGIVNFSKKINKIIISQGELKNSKQSIHPKAPYYKKLHIPHEYDHTYKYKNNPIDVVLIYKTISNNDDTDYRRFCKRGINVFGLTCLRYWEYEITEIRINIYRNGKCTITGTTDHYYPETKSYARKRQLSSDGKRVFNNLNKLLNRMIDQS